MKHRFQPGEQVVANDLPDATIFTIKALFEGAIAKLAYTNADGHEINAGEFPTTCLKYPTLQQLENAGELDK